MSVDRLELGLTEFRTELQKFRLEASRDNADLARGIKEEFGRVYERLDRIETGQAEILERLDRFETGQAEIRRLLERGRRWWPF